MSREGWDVSASLEAQKTYWQTFDKIALGHVSYLKANDENW
jgi:hypothetical protein